VYGAVDGNKHHLCEQVHRQQEHDEIYPWAHIVDAYLEEDDNVEAQQQDHLFVEQLP